MKSIVIKSLFAVILINSAFAQSANTLFTYGNNKVSAQEFLSVYKKNSNTKSTDLSESALTDYMRLYENFKLKVAEGRALKVDTLAALKVELTNYKKQLAKSYLLDKEVLESMYHEAWERSNTELHAAHIMVKLNADPSPADTLMAYKKIMAIYDRLMIKKEEFSDVAKDASEDASAKKTGGDVGYFSALQTLYPFENTAYSLKSNGAISKPFRTKVGYHIIKLIDKRASKGQVLTQHILVSVAKSANPTVMAAAEKKINSLYQIAKSGKISFDELARDSSDDKTSAKDNGKLPWFGAGKMVDEFEAAAFSLTNTGDISAPFKTDYGYHIVKLMDKKMNNSYEQSKSEIKKMVDKDARIENAKVAVINNIKKENKFSFNKTNYDVFVKALDSSLLKGTFKAAFHSFNKTAIFNLDNTNYTVANFSEYLESSQKNYRRFANSSADVAEKALPNWIDKICNDVAENKLDKKYPEFKTLMDEYTDGIILFDITDKNVWSKAVNDTVGLKEYYNAHQSKYMWGNRLNATIYRAGSDAASKIVNELIAKKVGDDSIKHRINAQNIGGVSIESGKYEKGANKLLENVKWEKGIENFVSDGIYVTVVVTEISSPVIKKLEESRGYVIADYQENLEKTWMEKLRAKYPIKEDLSVLKSLVK
jgi:peptidyl-prolyl cis-trans isomerase SurA